MAEMLRLQRHREVCKMKRKRNGELHPPCILIRRDYIRTCRDAKDYEGFARMVFSVETCVSGEEYEEPTESCAMMTFNNLVDSAMRGFVSCERQSERGRAGAAARHGRKSAVETAGSDPGSEREIPKPEKQTSGASCTNAVCVRDVVPKALAALTEAASPKEKFLYSFNDDPVAATMKYAHENSNFAHNTYNRYLKELGKQTFIDKIYAIYSEYGEDIYAKCDNVGAFLVSELKGLAGG